MQLTENEAKLKIVERLLKDGAIDMKELVVLLEKETTVEYWPTPTYPSPTPLWPNPYTITVAGVDIAATTSRSGKYNGTHTVGDKI